MPEAPKAAIALIQATVENQRWYLLIERAHDPRDYWSGHLSFPGGKIENGESPLEAALRETYEEVHITLQKEQLIAEQEIGFAGKPGVFGMWVKPFVFEIGLKLGTRIEPKELARAFWVAEEELLAPANQTHKELDKHTPGKKLPCIQLGEKVLWGFSLRVFQNHIAHLGTSHGSQ